MPAKEFMRIGLDYGGVISMSPGEWSDAILEAREKGYEFYLISHAQPYEESERQAFADNTGMINLTFSDLKSGTQEPQIAQRKANLCQQHRIQVFVDDDINRVVKVARNYTCATLYIPQSLWQVGLSFVYGLK